MSQLLSVRLTCVAHQKIWELLNLWRNAWTWLILIMLVNKDKAISTFVQVARTVPVVPTMDT